MLSERISTSFLIYFFLIRYLLSIFLIVWSRVPFDSNPFALSEWLERNYDGFEKVVIFGGQVLRPRFNVISLLPCDRFLDS